MRAAASSDRWSFELPLVGPAGEPVDLIRTFLSHGVASLPPMLVDEQRGVFRATLRIEGARARTVEVRGGRRGFGVVTALGPKPGPRVASAVLAALRHVLNMDEDLSGFYEVAAGDPALSWATSGAGRMIRSQTVFEEVVKTVCTTNCTWSATERMVGALVEHLGERAFGAPPTGPEGRAFPTPEVMAATPERFYRDVAKTGYRGVYLRSLAESVAGGELDLEALGRASEKELPDPDLAQRLLALPGVGPYAAAHIMMMMGRYSRLILDSWTRPTYLRIVGARSVWKDATIERRFRRYGRYAGLAFWLVLTRGWVQQE